MTALLSTTNYYYGNSTWGDLLTSYNNLPITYTFYYAKDIYSIDSG